MLQSHALEQVRVGQRPVGRFGRGPQRRTPQQHRDLAAHMRYCKLRKKTGSLRDLVKSHPDHHDGRHFGKTLRLTPNRICEIAFGQCQRRTFLAERYDVSKQTIRRALAFTAVTVLEVQLKQLKDLRDFTVANRPDFSSASLSWDETSQILSLDTMNTEMAPVLRHQTASSWEVMVSKLQVCTGWTTGLKLYHEFIVPPLPLSSNSASSLCNALFNHPFTKGLTTFVAEILNVSRWSAWVHETDAHLANEKLHYHLYQQRLGPEAERPGPTLPGLTEHVLCQNHQVQLSVVSAVNSLPKSQNSGGKIIPNLFCATLFLRMGGHFVRLLKSVQVVVKEATFFHWVPVPTRQQLAEGRLYSEQLVSYLIDNLQHSSREMSAKTRGAALSLS